MGVSCSKLHIGDLVTFSGSGCSVLDGGPGEVVGLGDSEAVRSERVWVRTRFACKPAGNDVKPGENFAFTSAMLSKPDANEDAADACCHSPRSFAPRELTDWDVVVIDTMLDTGGSFVAALAGAFRLADAENAAKLRAAFPEYWAKYEAMARDLLGSGPPRRAEEPRLTDA